MPGNIGLFPAAFYYFADMIKPSLYSAGLKILILILLTGLSSCLNKDKKVAAPAPEEFYTDYQVIAEDGDDKLLIKARFLDEEQGEVFALPEGVTLLLDGEQILADSTPSSGSFYETFRTIGEFEGDHKLILLQGEDTLQQTVFRFRLFQPVSVLPDTLKRADYSFSFEGLENEDYVRLMATDSSFYGRGINRLDTVLDGQVKLYRSDLFDLVSGPVQLMLIREWEQPVDPENLQRGKLTVNYMLQKEVFLED